MNFYNMNMSLGIAKDVDIDKQKYHTTSLFILNDSLDELMDNFLNPNIPRKLGSYIIFDYNNHLHDNYQTKFEQYGYKVDNYKIVESYDPFYNLSSEDDAKLLATTLIGNALSIKNNMKIINKEDNLFSNRVEFVLCLIIIYMLNKVPREKRSLLYLKKVIAKLYGTPDISYFKKVFANIDNTLDSYNSLFYIRHLTNLEFKQIITMLAKAVNEIPNELLEKVNTHHDLDYFKGSSTLTLQFIQVSKASVINSLFCDELLKNLEANPISDTAIPLILLLTAVDKIGYSDSLAKNLHYYNLKNIIPIVNIQNTKKFILLYATKAAEIMKEMDYGIFFPTQIENNLVYFKRILTIPNIEELVNQISVNPNYCVIYRANLQTTKELRLTSTQEINSNTQTLAQNVDNSSYSRVVDSEMNNLNTKDEILEKLKQDIDIEQNSIFRKHLSELYNTFS